MTTGDLFHGGDRPLPALEARLDALFGTSGDVPTRWVPRRLILQNYWLYDYQEFHFANGRLVLRGPNGSGKTSVLVSAVTLVLDARTTRSRLDPFGQSGRSMAYYLLGRAEAEEVGDGFHHEDRTGYVALELQHGGDGRFLTIGIGMRGRRLSGAGAPRVDAWGFLVRDGRRIGRDRPLPLTTDDGVPLTRSELSDRLAAGGAVFDRVADYQAEVNRTLFGFADEEEYEFLIQILLTLRSPKLNKELKPSDVAEMLAESLPALDPALLERVTQIMDDIDATRADIAATEANHERVRRVHLAAARLANQVAQERALDYRERQAAVEDVLERLVGARERAASQEDDLEEASLRLVEADRDRADLRGRLKVLRNHQAYRGRDALTTVEAEAARTRQLQAAAAQLVRQAHDGVSALEKQRSGLRERGDARRRQLLPIVGQLAGAAREAAWPLAEQRAEGVRTALAALELGGAAEPPEPPEPPELRPEALAEMARERRARFLEVLDALAGVARAEAERERVELALGQAESALRAGHDELRAAREHVERARDDLVVAVERWRADARELPAGIGDVAELTQRIHRLEDAHEVGVALLAPLLDRAARRRAELEAERDRARAEQGTLEVRRLQARAELDTWEAQDEAVPEARPGQVEARKALAAAGVPCVPLFQAVEPRAFLSGRNLHALHAALLQSGLLDALVVRAVATDAVARVLGEDGGDRWIRPHPLPEGTPTLADVLEPTRSAVPEEEIVLALRSVALQQDAGGPVGGAGDERAALDADGRWRLGPLEGRPAPVGSDDPIYLGREARVRARDRRIERLRGELSDANAAWQTARDDARALAARIERLDDDVRALRDLPGIGALAAALAVRGERTRDVEGLNARLREAEGRAADARRAVGAARQLHEAALRDAPAARGRGADGVRELLAADERVLAVAERVAAGLDALRELASELARILAAMGARLGALEEARAGERGAAQAVAEAEARVRTVASELAQLGFEAITEEVRRAEEREAQLEAEGRRLAGAIEGLKISLETTRAEVAHQGADRASREAERDDARARLAEAVRAYPTLADAAVLFGEGTEGAASRAADHLLGRREDRPTDLRLRIADDRTRAFQALAQEVTESRSALLDFHPSLDPDTGAVSFRHEGRELPPHALLDILERHRLQQMSVMREKEDELYEEFFLQEVSGRIREAIERAEESVKRVNALLAGRPLANEEILSLRWQPRREIGADAADHPRLVELLRRPASVLPPEDVRWIKAFFRERVRRVREEAGVLGGGSEDGPASFGEALRAVLDYRRWFAFTLHGKRPGEAAAEITNREFATRSGGEKSLAMFVPLLAALDARFSGARADAPKLVGLDEAFAGVDTDNINEMFAFMVGLDLSWIMTSEKLWGVGRALPACTTYQFHRQGTLAAVQAWLWDGRRNADESALARPDAEDSGELDDGAA